MKISTGSLIRIAAIGGVIVSSTGVYLQFKLIDRCRETNYYRNALKVLRSNPGAVQYLGEPIKDCRFKLSDTENNFTDTTTGRFCIPVVGPKDKGKYYIWLKNIDEKFQLTRAELELKSKPDQRFIMNKFIGTNKEKFFYHNTLICLLKSMEGRNVAVDLRNDSSVCGTVSSVDGYMNVSMINAVYCDNYGKEYYFETLFIQGRNVRYVHIPEHIPILTAIRDEFSRPEKTAAPTVKSRKAKKAQKQHFDTVALLKSSHQ